MTKDIEESRGSYAIDNFLKLDTQSKNNKEGADEGFAYSQDVLYKLFDGDAAITKQFISTLLLSNRKELLAAQEAVAVENLPELARVAHKIKGAARLIAAEPLIKACESIEHSEELKEMGGQLKKLEEEIYRLEQQLHKA
ncbi:Hpt domain-containing protein [Neisseriaceae bacterium TC5R-5]|nr:Hpt domain-containing protein [Neisseriaceae bacterium TC5R-5]